MFSYVPLLMLGVSLAGVRGLKCYSCNYTNVIPSFMSFCRDPFSDTASEAKSSIVSCTKSCIASKGKVYYDGGYLEGISRGCSAMNVSMCANACGIAQGTEGCEHCCDTDLCNSAYSVTFNLAVTFAILVLTLAF